MRQLERGFTHGLCKRGRGHFHVGSHLQVGQAHYTVRFITHRRLKKTQAFDPLRYFSGARTLTIFAASVLTDVSPRNGFDI